MRRRAQRHHHRAHIAFAQFVLQRIQAHAPAAVGRNRRILQLQHGGDALVGIVRLLGAHNPLAWRQLSGHPQRLQVGQCAAGGQVAQEFRPAEDSGDPPDGLNLHLRAGPATVARVVVGIDLHGQRIGGPRHRMRRLEHLPGIERMEVGVVVTQPARRGLQNPRHRRRDRPRTRKVGQSRELRLKQFGGAGKQAGDWILGHGNLSQ